MTDQPSSFVPEDLPVALEPIYSTPDVNQAVELYAGPLRLTQNSFTLSGEGVVRLEWLPRPRFWFHLHHGGDVRERFGLGPEGVGLSKALLRLVTTSQEVDVFVTQLHLFGGETNQRPTVSGLIEEAHIGTSSVLTALVFHVVNFKKYRGSGVRNEQMTSMWAGRAAIEVNDWRVTLDNIRFEGPTFAELKSVGGYAITHVGKLERVDGRVFSVDDVNEMMAALFRYSLADREFPIISVRV